PAAIVEVDFTKPGGPANAGILSCALVIGDRVYGLVPSDLHAGSDEPFVYDLAAGAFIAVSGITADNVPQSPPTSGDWVPPIMAQVASRILVTHPGFPGGEVKFGWFDVSGGNFVVVGDTDTDRYIRGAPVLLAI